MLIRTSIICLLILAYAHTSMAQSISALDEKCLKDGNDLVNRIGNPFSFNIHYSKKLAGCFARAAFYEHRDDGKVQGTTYLYNVSDGKIIGFLSYTGSKGSECWVEKAKCKSADEFDDLISPYIER